MSRRADRAQGEPRYDGRCRQRREPVPGVNPVVRFLNPDSGSVVVEDVVHGPITFDSGELDDLMMIARSDGTPTYNFCVVVDDYDMQITHVIRGDDHINNTPRRSTCCARARRRAAAVRARADDPGSGWREAFQASRRSQRAAVPR